MFTYEYDKTKHHIHEVPMASFLRRRLKVPDLVVYRHADSGKWVVAEWLPGRKWKVLETHLILETLSALTGHQIVELDYIFNGPPVDPLKVGHGADADGLRKDQECFNETRDVEKWLGKNYGRGLLKDHPYFKD